jgi:maltose O-acetyltransferase
MAHRYWPGLGRDLWLNGVIASPLFPKPLRWRALRLLGMEAERSNISPGVWFGSTRVSIGENAFINYNCFFNTSAPIAIGARCDIGMGAMFVTSTHEVGRPSRRAGAPKADGIVIGDGTWIGARATILPGVRIGPGVIIAAGSVVVSDCEENTLYAGVPARPVRPLDRESDSAVIS